MILLLDFECPYRHAKELVPTFWIFFDISRDGIDQAISGLVLGLAERGRHRGGRAARHVAALDLFEIVRDVCNHTCEIDAFYFNL